MSTSTITLEAHRQLVLAGFITPALELELKLKPESQPESQLVSAALRAESTRASSFSPSQSQRPLPSHELRVRAGRNGYFRLRIADAPTALRLVVALRQFPLGLGLCCTAQSTCATARAPQASQCIDDVEAFCIARGFAAPRVFQCRPRR